MINEVSRQRSTSSPLGSRFLGFGLSLPGGVCMPSWLVWIIVSVRWMCVCARFDTIFHFSPSLRHFAIPSHPRGAFSINGHTFHIEQKGGIWGAKRRAPIWEQSWSPSQSVTNTPMAKRLVNTVLQATRIFVLRLLFGLHSSNTKHIKGSFIVLK